MISAAAFLATLVLGKWCLTGANVWLRHGYDGFEFTTSKEFEKHLMEWRLTKGERAEFQSKRLDRGETHAG